MAIDDPITLNVEGVRELISSKINKVRRNSKGSDEEGPQGDELLDALSIDISDDELIKRKNEYERAYSTYEEKLKSRQETNKKYYAGKQLEGTQYDSDFPIASNLLFEAEETFLPIALSRNPEPLVWAATQDDIGTKLSKDVKTMLQYHSDVLVLRRKLARMVRHWSIYYLGIMKHGWDDEIQEIKCEVRNRKNFILDPQGAVDEYGDFDSWIGERVSVTAEKLADMFPKHKDYISTSVQGKTATEVVYTEWWSGDATFYFCTYKDVVLDKGKNYFFNYQEGAKNHFATPKKPYTFLSVYSLGECPDDITSLIEQNIPNQNLINKRTMQVDANLSRQNNSTAFSGDNFTDQTAKQAAQAMEKGHPIIVPAGRPITEAIVKFPSLGFPDAVFRELETNKQNLRNSFGTQGVTAEAPHEEQTARGMVLNQQRDSTRIGGGIGDALVQVADNIFNWWVQLYHVFYDEAHYAAILGSVSGFEYVTLSSQQFTHKLIVSVANDSMRPKDDIAEANQAIQLFQMGALDPKTLLTILDVPDTQTTIENTILWMTNRQMYIQKNFPEIAQMMMGAQQQSPQGLNPLEQGGQPQVEPVTEGASPVLPQLPQV